MIQKVFISYSNVDQKEADKISRMLSKLGVDFFLDRKDIDLGDPINKKIQEALNDCSMILIIISPASLKSQWVPYEIGQAKALNKTILPYFLHPSLDVPSYLQGIHYKTKLNDLKKFFKHLIKDSQTDKDTIVKEFKEDNGQFDQLTNETIPLHYLNEVIMQYEKSPVRTCYINREGILHPSKAKITNLEEWLYNRCKKRCQGHLTLILGEYGYGKSSLCLRIARALSQNLKRNDDVAIPLIAILESRFVAGLKDNYEKNLSTMLQPNLTTSQIKSILTKGKATLFLDGLDEVLAPHSPDERKAIVQTILASPLSFGCNVVATCRTHLFETLAEANELTSDLGALPDNFSATDRSAEVVSELLENIALKESGKSETKIYLVNLCKFSDKDIANYMSVTGNSSKWQKLKLISGVSDLASRPVILFLLSQVVDQILEPNPTLGKRMTVSFLYELAIRMWLRRDRRARHLDEEQVLEYLESQAVGIWYSAVLLSQYLVSIVSPWFSKKIIDSKSIEVLEDIGLLLRGESTIFPFSHYSFYEYFLARAVVRELSSYNASLLSSMHLVRMYTINQFLVEQLIPLTLKKENRNFRLRVPTQRINESEIMTSPINCPEFAKFLKVSGWREGGTLWGSSFDHSSEISPLEGLEIKDFEWGIPNITSSHAVTNISWYDALMFAKFVGGRLCTVDELRQIKRTNSQLSWEWSSEWLDYSRSLMSVVSEKSDMIGGANPDIRDSTISFRIAWD